MTIGDAVKAIRESLGKTQQDFSSEFHVTVTTVSRWETNRVTPHVSTLAVLFHKANELRLPEVASALANESRGLFELLGRKMIFRSWERFGQITSRILEFRQYHQIRGRGSAIPDDLWTSLDHALNLGILGKDDMQQLLAMIADPKPGTVKLPGRSK